MVATDFCLINLLVLYNNSQWILEHKNFRKRINQNQEERLKMKKLIVLGLVTIMMGCSIIGCGKKRKKK